MRQWQTELRRHGLGIILDIVPNHMSTHASNRWWNDVLENGQSSPFASYFDIDWHPVKPELDGKVLLPVLGEQYGEVLETGELQVTYSDGTFNLRYMDRLLPLDPQTTSSLLAMNLSELRGAARRARDLVRIRKHRNRLQPSATPHGL